jgi:acyl dehydratase
MNRPSMAEIFQRFQPGVDLGTSDWIQITQEMVDKFGEATLDDDPMHVDPDWARRHSPFGKTVAFGFLTISLLTHVLLQQLLKADSSRHDSENGVYLNYGFDRLRLVAPVPVGSRVRAHFSVMDVRPDAKGRSIIKFNVEMECDQADRPVLIAEWLSCWVPPNAL